MKDTECIGFLQQTLPTLHMQWQGFRKVRKQVCKRIKRRLQALGLSDIATYSFLERLNFDAQKLWVVAFGR